MSESQIINGIVNQNYFFFYNNIENLPKVSRYVVQNTTSNPLSLFSVNISSGKSYFINEVVFLRKSGTATISLQISGNIDSNLKGFLISNAAYNSGIISSTQACLWDFSNLSGPTTSVTNVLTGSTGAAYFCLRIRGVLSNVSLNEVNVTFSATSSVTLNVRSPSYAQVSLIKNL